MDDLRADHLSLYGYRKVTSPNIDSWAGHHGVTFSNVVAASPWTLPSHVSLLSGLDALSHGVNFPQDAAGKDVLFLAEALREAGYRTGAVTGGGFLRPEYGFHQGFDRFRWWPGEIGHPDELDDGLDTALRWIETWADGPFFLFFHTYEVHSPFHRREPHFERLGGRLQELKGECSP